MNNSHQELVAIPGGLEPGLEPVSGLASGLRGVLFPRRVAGEGIWPRIGLLFAVLSLVKLDLLIGLRKHLFEIHWRVGGEPYNWLNTASFYLFAVLVSLLLWRLGTHCMPGGRRVIRAANACVLLLGGAFILLTFHEGEKNWLSPVMNSVLTWTNLTSYLSLDSFFQMPYLAAWVFLYVLVYYLLSRTGREHLILRVTAVCAGVYVATCLRDFTKYHNALVVVDCVGIACLLSGWGTRRGLGAVWIGLFMLGSAFSFGLFYGLDTKLSLGELDPEFAVLTGTALVLLAGATLLAWRFGFLAGWSWILPFALSAFLLFFNINYGAAPNYQKLLSAGFALPRYFLGEFSVAAGLLVLAWGYRRWRPAGSLWWLDLVSLLLIAYALADLRLTQIMGVRLDWQALSLALGETPRMMWRMARPFLPSLLGALAIVLVLYVMLLQWLRHKGRRLAVGGTPRIFSGARFFLISSLLLGYAGEQFLDRDKAEGESALLLAQTSPSWRRTLDPAMDRKTFLATAQALGMDELVQPAAAPALKERPMNVVLVFQESSYNKYLSLFDGTEDTQPSLSAYKDRMELFPNFFTSFAGSINARFAAFTGLYPVPDYRSFTLDPVPVRSIFELLHDHGYTTSLFYSSFCDYTGFRDFLTGREVDEIYDADTMPGERKSKPVSWGLREDETLGAIQAQIRRYSAEKQKFFLTYIPAAPHYPYDGTPYRFCKSKAGSMGDYTPLYLNELRYMDWIITSILDQLKESGVLDNTLVIITDDHGELLGEDGGPIGHGWAVTPELANIPLIIMDPGKRGYRINDAVGSQVDLLPTMLDLVGIAAPEHQLCQGRSLYSAVKGSDRTIYLNSFHQYAILRGRQFFSGNRDGSVAGTVTGLKLFNIENQGAHTLFVAEPRTNASFPSISVFDKFQQNLLRHYAQYCLSLHPAAAAK